MVASRSSPVRRAVSATGSLACCTPPARGWSWRPGVVDRLEALAAELGDRVLAVECDVVDEASTANLIDATVERWGRIDVLVNNAGFGTPVPSESESMEHFRQTIDVNLTGTFVADPARGASHARGGVGHRREHRVHPRVRGVDARSRRRATARPRVR